MNNFITKPLIVIVIQLCLIFDCFIFDIIAEKPKYCILHYITAYIACSDKENKEWNCFNVMRGWRKK